MAGSPAPDASDQLPLLFHDESGDLRSVLEEVLDRKLGEALKERFVELSADFHHLGEECSALTAALKQNRFHASPSGSSSQSAFAGATASVAQAKEASGLPAQDHEPSSAATDGSSREGSSPERRSGSRSSPQRMPTSAVGIYMKSHAESSQTGDHFMSSKATSPPQGADKTYEDLFDLTRAFEALCSQGWSVISVRELMEMSANQQGLEPLDPSLANLGERFATAIVVLNKELGAMPTTRSTELAKDVTLHTYIAIMQWKRELFSCLDTTVIQTISEIRDILVKEDAIRRVARATNLTAGELYRATKEEQARSSGRLETFLRAIDPFIGLLILANAIVIAVSTDVARDSDVWTYLEIIFTAVFLIELGLKMAAHGPFQLYFGVESSWNIIDTCVVVVGVLGLCLKLMGQWFALDDFSMVRLLRFARLTRLVRVLKLRLFKELALMVNGILVGFRTLFWAGIFLGFLLFSLGVLLTTTIGHLEPAYWNDVCQDVQGQATETACASSASHLRENQTELFGNVFRSMFTVFRCFMDGCSSTDGAPLVPHFFNTLGMVMILPYMVVMVFVIFGLFNLIMAVFVENTINNARDARRREAHFVEHIRLASKLQEVIVMFCKHEEHAEQEAPDTAWARFQGWFRSVFSTATLIVNGESELPEVQFFKQRISTLNVEVSHDAFIKVLRKPEVKALLDDLDIDTHSRHALFDILDANGNGTLEVNELVQGLLKLRGTSDKAELIAALLSIRSLQKSMRALEVLSLHQQQVLDKIAETQERHGSEVEHLWASHRRTRALTLPPSRLANRGLADREPSPPKQRSELSSAWQRSSKRPQDHTIMRSEV